MMLTSECEMRAKREFLEPREAADHLGGVPVQTLARWRSEGAGPPWIKLVGRVRYDVHDLEAWIASQRRQTAQRVSTAA